MPDLLQLIWPAVEAVHPVFSRAAVVRWPKGAHAQLALAKLIVPHGTAPRIRCPECGKDHRATPIARIQPDGSTRLFIACPEHGRADVTHLDRQQWAVNVEALVTTIAGELALTGTPTDLCGGRVWRCGRTSVAGKSRDVLFARGLARQDADQFRRAITSAHLPILFVGSELPPPENWRGALPALIRLRDVASFDGERFTLESQHVRDVIADGNTPSATVAGLAVPKKELSRIVRQQIKAEAKTTLEDDVLVAAYRQAGSYDKAAALLNQNPKANKRVTRDRVGAAVLRAGGVKAVVQEENSDSILRGVASQRRDRRGKPLIGAQGTDDSAVT